MAGPHRTDPVKARATLYIQLQRLIGSRVDLAYRNILRAEALSSHDYAQKTKEALISVLALARATIPYYREQADKLDEGSLTSFPILTKESLNQRYPDLMSPQLRAEYDGGKSRGYGWVEVRSGGTTGVPVAVIHGSDFRDHDRALRMYQMDLCGFPFGTPYFRLWGSMQDVNRMKDSRFHRIMSALAGETILNAFRMETRDLDRYLEILCGHKTSYMMAYIDAAVQLADRALQTDRRPAITSIMACAGTVTDAARATLQSAFGARVHNKYGTRDAGEIACECDHGGLHILPGVVVEVVNEQGRPCPAGTTGRILVTCLHNKDFPIIRYEIGDVGALAEGECACGRPYPRLERLEGRSTEFLRSTSGGYVSPVYIRHVIGVVHPPAGLRRYQLEQTDARSFILRLELEPGARTDRPVDTADLQRDLLAVLGNDAVIQIQPADHIPESESGKFRYIINRHGSFR